ncbi:MAG: polysaccharide biosynthesis/export family protein [Alphaproteobacteria bacterium]
MTVGLVLGLIVLAACGGPPARVQTPTTGPVVQPASVLSDYRLGPGDQLSILVFNQDELSGVVAVDADGQVILPLVGLVPAGGQTVGEFQETLRVLLDEKYLVNPQVSVEVAEYRPFFILGQVAAPGGYAFTVGLDVRQAVALAGGFTRRARTDRVIIIRQTAAGRTKYFAGQDVPILPGDTIDVERRFF